MKTQKTLTIIVPDAPLKRGDRCLGVMYLQVALQYVLRLRGKDDIVRSENGYFGIKTETAVRSFQEKNHIHIDGRYTDLTRRVLREVLKCK
jgi:peptidoglycan hydrolase-like protein with peptidoglycan-binding domain